MIGFYENFPINIHRIETFSTLLSNKKLQQRIIQVFHEINHKKYSFEEVTIPTIPNCSVMFEIGLADSKIFNFIDKDEREKTLNLLSKEPLQTMDFFCAVRYYKDEANKKKPLKFDYYLLRTVFGKNLVETRIFHERGPRYILPEDIINFLINKINDTSKRRIMKMVETT